MEPITRKEHYLAALGGQEVTPPDPLTRIETMLNDILNSRTVSLTPMNRVEHYLAIISGVALEPLEPVTRIEMYLAKIAGMEVEPPDPVTREEHFLADWIDGGLGVLVTVTGLTPLALANALAGQIKSMTQTGKCVQSGTPTPEAPVDIVCNNGALRVVDDELPSGYKRLKGITFDGNFHYETGEALTGDDVVTMTLDNLSTSGKNVFGSYNGANSKNFSLYIYGSSTSGSYFRFGDQLKRPIYGGTGRRTITFGAGGTSGFAEDVSIYPNEFTTPANTYIGMLPNSSSAAYSGDIIGSILVGTRLEWIPCESDDGVIGYYERVNGNYIAPTGDGTPVSLGYDYTHSHLAVVGTPEVLTVGTQTATVANLYAVGDYADTQNIISGAITRRVGVLVLDGTETWGQKNATDGRIIMRLNDAINQASAPIIVTHGRWSTSSVKDSDEWRLLTGPYLCCYSSLETTDDFKARLAAQYAAGTPVIVFYPLAEATTEQVTAQPLTTAKGDNTISATTAVGNVEITAVYTAAKGA